MQDSLVKILEIDRKLETCICHRSIEQDLIHFIQFLNGIFGNGRVQVVL